MTQPSIANYFNTRKRTAIDELKINNTKKVLLLDGGDSQITVKNLIEKVIITSQNVNNNKKDIASVKSIPSEASKINLIPPIPRKKVIPASRSKKVTEVTKMGNIEHLLNNMSKNKVPEVKSTDDKDTNHLGVVKATPPMKVKLVQPTTPTKQLNAMDKVNLKGTEPTIAQLKQKLSRSSRLAELKASLARFKQSEQELRVAEKKSEQLKESCCLKNFKAIELEVNLSPKKPQSPHKEYLSPKKDTTTVRRNLFNLQSPIKNTLVTPTIISRESIVPIVKESLTLPYKYRCLAEIFRAIDTVCQILYNRKETITFKKLKPAVEEMIKRNLTEKHLGQIMFLYSESFQLQWEKLRQFGTGTRQEHWELVIQPQIEQETMTSEVLLARRRKLFKILIDKLKDYHQEFLMELDPPMEIPRDKITRWHPEFDIEKIPDVEISQLPQSPQEETLTTGSDVLAKAREMFNCNTRMERALEKLKTSQENRKTDNVVTEGTKESILKGIPKALLEKVRQKQAAKALETITRSTVKEKEVQLYSRLPEIARLARNLFVTEKKSVLPIDLVLDKLCHSYRVFSTRAEMEEFLKTIAKEVNGWLTFCELRGGVYVKLSKNADLSLVVNKLQSLVEQKSTPT